jgi:hypothetical protein
MASLQSPAFKDRTGKLADGRWPDPFCDIASLSMPDTIQDALRWCEYILMANGPYREAISLVVSYFITDVTIDSVSAGTDQEARIGREEKQKYLDFLNDTLGIKSVLQTAAMDFLCYGNSMTSLLIPFRRYLSCPGCGTELPLKKIYNTPEFGFSWSGYQFNANCPWCSYQGAWKHIDRRSVDPNQIKVKRWSPHDMEILWDPHTHDRAYIWKIPDDYRNQIRKGHLFHLERASWEIVQAVKNNQALLFDPDVIYHMTEESFAGVNGRGWGISRVLTNFRQAWYCQVLQRYNEAIALDYVIPFRVITPQPRAGQGGEINDPVLSINMGSFTGRVQNMLKQRRRDPARWNILPFPIEYQALGGDATQLAPKDLMDQGLQTLLSSIGVPLEMFNASMTTQSAPAALRLFEAKWAHLVHHLNRFLSKLVDKIAQVMSWEPVNCRLQRVTHADDLNRQMAKLQLMMGGQISRTTGLHAMGVEFGEEERLKLEEERITAEATQDMQKEMEQSALMDEMAAGPPPAAGGAAPAGAPPAGAPPAAGGAMPMMQGMPGAMPGGGMPAPAAGAPPAGDPAAAQFAAAQPTQPNVPTTPEEMEAQADTIAQQLMALPDAQRKSELIKLKKEDSTMHALVQSKMDQIRQDAAAQGQQAVLDQQFPKQAAQFESRTLRNILLDE